MKKHLYLPLLGSMLLLVACQEEITLDLPPNDPELVVEGYLTDLDFYIPDGDLNCFGDTVIPREIVVIGAQIAAGFPVDSAEETADFFPFNKVILTSTADYFSNEAPPAVSNAVVKLMKDGELVETLVEDENEAGVYRITHDPEVGSYYHLEIEALDNFYETEPELYRSVPPMIGLEALYQPNFLGDTCAYYMGIQTYEKAGAGDHYRWMFYINGEYERRPNFISISNDEGIDGFCLFGFDVYGDELELGDTITAFQMITSEAYYDFSLALRSRTGQVGSPFDAPPSPITGNVNNITTGAKANGFFAAGGLTANYLVVPDTVPNVSCP